MKKTVLISFILVATLLFAGAAFAWPGHHGKGSCENSSKRDGQGMSQEQHQERMENRLEKMAVILDLTETQKKQIETLMDEKWENHQTMRTQMQAGQSELREYKQGDEFNESEFRAKAQKQADLKTEMMVQHAKTRQQLLAVLTHEQQQKAEKLKGMDGEGFFGKRGDHGDGRGHGMHKGKGSVQHHNSCRS